MLLVCGNELQLAVLLGIKSMRMLRPSVCVSVSHNWEAYKNCWTNQGSVWGMDSGEPKEPHFWCRGVPDLSAEGAFLSGVISRSTIKNMRYMRSIKSTIFGRWQQRRSPSLSILQHLIVLLLLLLLPNDLDLSICSLHREQKCADTIGTVSVPWAGHFQC